MFLPALPLDFLVFGLILVVGQHSLGLKWEAGALSSTPGAPFRLWPSGEQEA